MNVIGKFQELGFTEGLTWIFSNGEFVISEAGGSNLPPPLVYVVADRNGTIVRSGRALKQTLRQREGSTAKGLNGRSTYGQNNKPVIIGLREEVKSNGPLTSFVKPLADEASAREYEIYLHDHFPGRLDKRRG